MAFRTDLIMENDKVNVNKLPEGVSFKEESIGHVSVQILEIKTLKASVMLGKPIGKYISGKKAIDSNSIFPALKLS